jgi:hypothetical protein
MKKIILILSMVMLLGGCGVPTYKADIEKAEELCANNGGIRSIRVPSWGDGFSISCNNGAQFHVTWSGGK